MRLCNKNSRQVSYIASRQFSDVTLETRGNLSALVFQSHSINSLHDEIKKHELTEFWVNGVEPHFNGEAFPAFAPRFRGRTDLSKGWVKIDGGASRNNKEEGGMVGERSGRG